MPASGQQTTGWSVGAGPLAIAAICMLLFWAHYETFWARYTVPRMNVRWSDAATAQTREDLETAYGLTARRQEEGQTWSYLLTDMSASSIRRLVADPAVEDTHNIDRRRFELTGDNPPGPFEGRYWFLWSAVLSIAAGLIAAWIGQERLRSARVAAARAAQAAFRAAAATMTRGVPEARAEVLGFFRFFYATFLFIALNNGRLVLEAGRIPDDGQLGWAWIGWLSSRPDPMALLELAILVLLVPFAIGLWTRAAYWLIGAGMTVWVLVWIESQHSNAHLWLATSVMIVCLLPVPWDAALSVDEVLRRRRGKGYGPGLRGKVYGYPMWMPGLILGTVWASAAYAKLESSGTVWILGGAVKYHWVIDAPSAAVDWGLWVASHHWAAVVMAFCGVCFEAVFILSVFVKAGPWRHMLTSTGLVLLLGFYLFHGVLWWTWWLAFLSFATPWEPLYMLIRSRGRQAIHANAPSPAPTAARLHGRLRPIHLTLIVLVCVHAMLRLPAGFGRFESYSNTYGSTDEFDRIAPIDPIDHLWAGYGTARAVEVEADVVVDAILALTRNEPLPSADARTLRELDDVRQLFADLPKRLTLTRQRKTFNWTNGRFNPPGPAVVIGTLDLESMTLVEADRGDG